MKTLDCTDERTTSMDKLKRYWNYAGERSIKTVAQTAIATIGADALGITTVDWFNVLSVSALAGIMSLLMSVLVYDKAGE